MLTIKGMAAWYYSDSEAICEQQILKLTWMTGAASDDTVFWLALQII